MAWNDVKNTGDKLTAVEYNAMVADQIVRISKSLFDANTILKADSDDTPVALTIAEQRILGRITAGSITGLTAAQVRTLCDVPSTSEAVLDTLFDAYSILYADTDNTPAALTIAASRLIGRKATGGIAALTAAEARTILSVSQTSDVVLKSLYDAYSILYADTDNTPAALTVAASRFMGRKAAGGIAAMTVAEAKTLLAIAIADISGIPGTIVNILTDHDTAAHDALGIAPASHGADKHTDRQRYIWIPVNYAEDGLGVKGTYSGGKLTDGATKKAYGTLAVPKDYISSGKLKAIIISSGTGNIEYILSAYYAADGEAKTTHPMTDSTNEAVTAENIEVLSILLNLSTYLADGDFIGIEMERLGGYGNDTVNADVYCLGFRFQYIADM